MPLELNTYYDADRLTIVLMTYNNVVKRMSYQFILRRDMTFYRCLIPAL